MYKMDSKLAETLIDGYSRRFYSRLTIVTTTKDGTKETVFEGNNIVKITGNYTAGEQISLGVVAGKTLNIEIISENPPPIGANIFKGGEVFWEICLATEGGEDGNTYGDLQPFTYCQLKNFTVEEITKSYAEWIPMGRFLIDEEKWQKKHCTFECSDRISLLDIEYKPTTLPCRSSIIETEILNSVGLEPSDPENLIEYAILCDEYGNILQDNSENTLYCEGNTFLVEEIPEGATSREMLGYIASYKGKFAVTDRQGKLLYSWYICDEDGENKIIFDPNKFDQPEIDGDKQTIHGLKCFLDDENFVATAHAPQVVFKNPFMTAERLEKLNIYAQDKRITWYPMEINYRSGDPRLDVWDVGYLDLSEYGGGKINFPCAGLEITFDGGFSVKITAPEKQKEV